MVTFFSGIWPSTFGEGNQHLAEDPALRVNKSDQIFNTNNARPQVSNLVTLLRSGNETGEVENRQRMVAMELHIAIQGRGDFILFTPDLVTKIQ